MAQPIYYGETTCQKESCKIKGYYTIENTIYCGVHSRNKTREDLPKRDKSEVEQIKREKFLIER